MFTTHTAVGAGHDSSHPMGAKHSRAIPRARHHADEFLALGRYGEHATFNMTRLACGSGARQRGQRDSRPRLFETLREHLARHPPAENPVGYVTNGVHVPTFMRQGGPSCSTSILAPAGASDHGPPAHEQHHGQYPTGVFW